MRSAVLARAPRIIRRANGAGWTAARTETGADEHAQMQPFRIEPAGRIRSYPVVLYGDNNRQRRFRRKTMCPQPQLGHCRSEVPVSFS